MKLSIHEVELLGAFLLGRWTTNNGSDITAWFVAPLKAIMTYEMGKLKDLASKIKAKFE